MSERVLEVDGVSKEYRLGMIGGGTLHGDLTSWFARVRGKEDPNVKIGKEHLAHNQKFWALKDVTFGVNRGDAVAMLGRNGAGKSTMLKLISRITAPTEGEIRIRGRVASLLEIGTGFHPELSGRDNIYLNGAILGMNRAETTGKLKEIVEFSETWATWPSSRSAWPRWPTSPARATRCSTSATTCAPSHSCATVGYTWKTGG